MKDVCLPQFEGPLDLLLALVKKSEVEISELPIAEVTGQYLAYLGEAKDFDIDLGADFAYMAATLIQIKSRSLLPKPASDSTTHGKARDGLIQELLSFEQMKIASDFLRRKLEENFPSWSVVPESTVDAQTASIPNPDFMDLQDVLALAKRALAEAHKDEFLQLESDTVTIAQMENWLEDRLAMLDEGSTISAEQLFADQASHETRIFLFLALLEKANQGRISLQQPLPVGTLWIQRATPQYGTSTP